MGSMGTRVCQFSAFYLNYCRGKPEDKLQQDIPKTLKKGRNSEKNQNSQKMKKVVIEHQCSKLFANFQRGISITAEAKLKTDYQRIYGKKLKKGHNSGKNKKFKKIKKAILDNQFKHVFANFQLFISITV